MIHPSLGNHPKESHLSEAYLYVQHDICLSKYQIIQIGHKNVLMNKYQKVFKEAAQANEGCGRICCSILSLWEIFFALNNKLVRNLIAFKKMHVCGAFLDMHDDELPHGFLSLLSSPTFSHTKSVIIAQETRNTATMLSLFLQKHDNYRIQLFYVFLWHHER